MASRNFRTSATGMDVSNDKYESLVAENDERTRREKRKSKLILNPRQTQATLNPHLHSVATS